MKNTYLKRFMPVTWESNKHEIAVTFQVLLYNDQTIRPLKNRIGDGFALCRFKIEKLPDLPKMPQRLETVKANLDLDKRSWDDPDYPDHITTLVIKHNPSIDSDSMATSDAPMF